MARDPTERGVEVSVVLPAFNAERFIGTAIESVLAQTFEDFELIVVDDGSVDATSSIAAGYDDPRLELICHVANRGLVAALNTGLDHARGRLIAIQHADDVSLPDRLAGQVELFRDNPRLAIVGTAWELVDQDGRSLGIKRRPALDADIRWFSLFFTPFGHPTVMVRADVVREHGLRYEASYFPAEDYALWSRILEHGQAANLEAPLVRYRVHDSQITAGTWDLQNEIAARIASSNFRRLGILVEPEAMPALRALCAHPPARLTPEDFSVFSRLLAASQALRARSGTDDADARRIARVLIDTVLGSVLRGGRRGLIRSGALRIMLKIDATWTLTSPARWLRRRFERDDRETFAPEWPDPE